MGCGTEETALVSRSFDGNAVVSGFVVVVDDDCCVKVERPDEIIDRDANVQDERTRSEVGFDVL